MSPHPPRATATPRWTTLALLGTAVLGLHLLLLGGWTPLVDALPTGTPAALGAPEVRDTTHAAPTPSPSPAAAAAPSAPVSTVRWIVASTATAAPGARPPPAEKPKPAAKSPPPALRPLPQRQADAAVANAPLDETADATQAVRVKESDTGSAPQTEPPKRAEAAPTAVPETDSAPQALPAPADVTAPPVPPEAAVARGESRPPASLPASTQLAYDVTGTIRGLNYSASGTLAWTQADGHYGARMELRLPLLGSRVQTSTGRVEVSGVLPTRFSDQSRSERAAHFDHAQQTIRFSNNRPEATLQPGAQDRLSLFMQLAGLLNAQPAAYPAGQLISLQVAGASDAEIWRFRVGDEETLALPAGILQARRLVREPREPRDSRIDIWLAPTLAYLPVRIRITQDSGDRVDQQLRQMP
ncbi:MAG: DUF3108 domain-containing protein [Hydrogenophaga sp.]|uniref:DUF3108 domain-containing protein n=1 Tax=Hydrogenophaga sp. TaxID=1904254 RepID=UPI001BC4DF63|nr:DUF3108 domain-containing protein [Hydrogenophaga sp.]MBS3911026.1 DUF3108 domain-containing protein [Hydrogenophaga sp.]MDO9149402.1 DUF3108 domain-containing protein [Hydrogenophaga sp.]MDO9602980.1 DUF3108 domain-containing protein [Hydrogenophaga sp.]MDP2166381.1 DUF3108 domain-containing protein [Hydrogenophaga sp.]MDP3475737.1 DUF3108 domain-containing protein [Hydrogenophaga sp.]